MATWTSDKIRNIALIGHSGEGKTSLLEAILFQTGAIKRLGKVDDGSSVSDYDDEEKARKFSINLTASYVTYKDYKFNVLDVPGFFDFEGEMIAALSVADAAVLVTSAAGAVPVGAEKAIEYCTENNIPLIIWINGVNKENTSFEDTLKAYKEMYGNKVVAIEVPIMNGTEMQGFADVFAKKAYDLNGKEIAIPASVQGLVDENEGELLELAAESSEELLEKFFSGEDLTVEEKKKGIKIRVQHAECMPIFAGVAIVKPILTNMLDYFVDLLPSASEAKPVKYIDLSDKSEKTMLVSQDGKFAAQIFKTTVDQFIGKLLLFKVIRGSVTSGDNVYNTNVDEGEKISQISFLRGSQKEAADVVNAGDIAAFAKLNYTSTNHTLCDPSAKVKFEEIPFPKPVISFAVYAEEKGTEDKVFAGFNRLMDEDSTFVLEKNQETNEMLLSGLGEMQLEILNRKVKNKFGAKALLQTPRVSYRETIKKTVEAEGKHKKQSGGAGQFGQCSIRFEPGAEDGVFEFVDAVVGGAIPRQYIPAVEKGLREALPKGILADYPMVNLKATVFDGKHHPVDSKEIAFISAAKLAYQDGCSKANPVFLEPIMSMKIIVPDTYMGDIMGDLNKRRGRILGTDVAGGKAVVEAEVPQAEIGKYATDLRSMTQGRGKFSVELARYEEVPASQTEKIIADYKRRLEEEQ